MNSSNHRNDARICCRLLWLSFLVPTCLAFTSFEFTNTFRIGFSQVSVAFEEEPHETKPSSKRSLPPAISPSFESSMYTENRPIRRVSKSDRNELDEFNQNPWNDWGMEQLYPPPPDFPHTVIDVADAAYEAIAATLYGKQRLDPNIVQNAVMGDHVHGRRPVRSEKDAGRIGIEIDGADHLFYQRGQDDLKASALRSLALVLAGQLSRGCWDGFEEGSDCKISSRPIAVFFNTVKQALAASQELQRLKHANTREVDCYGNVTIHNLCQDGCIPESMLRNKKSEGVKRGRKSLDDALAKGRIDPTRGLIIIVQPTDYNEEYKPPGPAIGSLEALQRVVAQAAVEQLAAVVISPRFLAKSNPSLTGWDQSGYQQSASYGGYEPPRGPTPWIMRDFSPPVFSWIGKALRLPSEQHVFNDEEDECYYSRLAMLQSVNHDAHSWHVYAAKHRSEVATTTFEYIASTKSAAGRPTRDVLRRLFHEFATYS